MLLKNSGLNNLFSNFKSYGGYIAAMALLTKDSEYSCAISGAPVVDWQFYGILIKS